MGERGRVTWQVRINKKRTGPIRGIQMSIEKILMGEGTRRRHYEVQLEENRIHTGEPGEAGH
jgi:hypothetical protein